MSTTSTQISTSEHPLFIAYQLGRKLRRLEFVALGYCLSVRNRTEFEATADELGRYSRRVAAGDARHKIQEDIARQSAAFLQTVTSEWYAEQWHGSEEALARGDDDADEPSGAVCGPADRLFESVRGIIADLLDAAGHLAMELGLKVEALPCHVECLRRTQEWHEIDVAAQRADRPFLMSPPVPGQQAPTEQLVETHQRAPRLARQFYPNCVQFTGFESWQLDLQGLWRELALAEDEFPVGNPDSWMPEDLLLGIRKHLDRLEGALQSELKLRYQIGADADGRAPRLAILESGLMKALAPSDAPASMQKLRSDRP